MGGNKIVVASINASGLNNTRNVYHYFNELKIIILILLLFKNHFVQKDFGSVFNRQWKGQAYHSYTDSKHARGVCILIRKYFACNIHSYCNDNHGRKLLLNIEYDDCMYTIDNLYCPTNLTGRISFLKETVGWVSHNRINNGHLVIGGDMNCVNWPSDRKSFVTDRSSETLTGLKDSLSGTDMWKDIHPDTDDFTYIDPSFRHNDSRIDILCVCDKLKPSVELCDHVINPCPDHKAVILSVRGA